MHLHSNSFKFSCLYLGNSLRLGSKKNKLMSFFKSSKPKRIKGYIAAKEKWNKENIKKKVKVIQESLWMEITIQKNSIESGKE